MLPVVHRGLRPKRNLSTSFNSLLIGANTNSRLSKPLGYSASRATFTFDFWVRRGSVGLARSIFSTYFSALAYDRLEFTASDTLRILQVSSGSTVTDLVTTKVFKDPATWYHIHIIGDSSKTAQERIRLEVNGEPVAWSGTNPGVGSLILWGEENSYHYIGYDNIATTYAELSLNRFCYVDGLALPSSNFLNKLPDISVEPASYEQVLKKVNSGNAGSFILNFSDITSATTMAYDSSSKTNHWTPINMLRDNSVSDCLSYDNPQNVIPVLSFLDNGGTLQKGNLSITGNGPAHATTNVPPNQKIYFEASCESSCNAGVGFGLGVVRNGTSFSIVHSGGGIGVIGFYASAVPNIISVAGGVLAISGLPVAGDIMQVAIDGVNLWIGRNNVWLDSAGGSTGNPATGSNPTLTLDLTHRYIPYVGAYANTSHVNFGQRPWSRTCPAGFKALPTTQNLQVVTR